MLLSEALNELLPNRKRSVDAQRVACPEQDVDVVGLEVVVDVQQGAVVRTQRWGAQGRVRGCWSRHSERQQQGDQAVHGLGMMMMGLSAKILES